MVTICITKIKQQFKLAASSPALEVLRAGRASAGDEARDEAVKLAQPFGIFWGSG